MTIIAAIGPRYVRATETPQARLAAYAAAVGALSAAYRAGRLTTREYVALHAAVTRQAGAWRQN